ncbi:MAG TPA: endoglucanase [Cytophagales bacterium]|jgi:putative aminopeptidase FrvX|nr:endoglucanase [Cytophagales bacterium]
MSLNIPLLKKICETPGAPGYETKIRNLIIEEVKSFVDELSVDNLGNILAVKRAKSKNARKVMVAAHMDEIGFMVRHIDDNGFVRFHTLGGFDPKTLTAQRVKVHGKEVLAGVMGTKPIHVLSPEEREKLPKTTDYFIDLGLLKDQVEKLVKIGDPITWERELIEIGECVNCKAIDNRVSVFVLVETLKAIAEKELEVDVYGVFTVQEEVGIRGASVSAHTIDPDFGIALDTTIANDVPGALAHDNITQLGKGAAIKLMDGSVISDYRMVRFMKQTADQHKIIWQPELLPAGGTDTSGVQRMGKNGAISGAISVPTRFLHQVIEMAHQKDIENCINLLEACLQDIEKYDWSHD